MRWLVIVAIVLVPRLARAEMEYADALEWQTADAQLVVVGRVAAVTRYPDSAGTIWYRVRFAVRETLKGSPRASVDLVVRESPAESPLDWRARDAELLMFLVDSKRRGLVHGAEYARAPFALRESPTGDDEALDLGRPRAFTRALELVTTRAEILAVVRRATSGRAPAAELLELDAAAYPAWLMSSKATLWLHVPLDPPTEALARRWIRSSDRATRIGGVAVLVHFPSQTNAGLLLPLVDDPMVGARIHRALVAWGVPHVTAPRSPRPEPAPEPTR